MIWGQGSVVTSEDPLSPRIHYIRWKYRTDPLYPEVCPVFFLTILFSPKNNGEETAAAHPLPTTTTKRQTRRHGVLYLYLPPSLSRGSPRGVPATTC